jgi:hypothetical protein
MVTRGAAVLPPRICGPAPTGLALRSNANNLLANHHRRTKYTFQGDKASYVNARLLADLAKVWTLPGTDHVPEHAWTPAIRR